MKLENEKKYRDKDREYQRKKRLSGKIDKTEEYRKYRLKYPQKVKAQQKINYLIKIGKIKRGECMLKDEWCSDMKSQAHHPDYNYPINVIWLCPSHHKKVDLGIIKLKHNVTWKT